MATAYLRKLVAKIRKCGSPTGRAVKLDCRHFFNGAALYANGRICASLTPVGFAIKLPDELRLTLLKERSGRALRYFPGAPIKKEYVLLSRAATSDSRMVRELLRASVQHVTARRSSLSTSAAVRVLPNPPIWTPRTRTS